LQRPKAALRRFFQHFPPFCCGALRRRFAFGKFQAAEAGRAAGEAATHYFLLLNIVERARDFEGRFTVRPRVFVRAASPRSRPMIPADSIS
jgi:hypothetical protein